VNWTSRASNATYYDVNGTLKKSSYNLLLQSEDFSTTWASSAASISTNTAIAPNGITSADTFIPDSGVTISGNGNFHNLRQALTVLNATTYTLSCYVKPAGYSVLRFGLSSQLNLVNNYSDITVNLTTLSVTQTLGTGTVIPVGNGWYQITATGTTTGTTAYAVFIVADGGTADGTSGIYLWGAQLEEGSFPTSYIPTEGSEVTRAADVASISGSNFSSWYRQDEGTIFARYDQPEKGLSLAVINDGTSSNSIVLFGATVTSQQISANMTISAANQGRIDAGGSFVANATSKVALATSTNGRGLSCNGSAVTASASPSSMPTLSELQLQGSSSFTARKGGHIARFAYWPQRLPNDTLQTITQ
jgi:hypothetical protein